MRSPAWLREAPLVARWVIVGACSAGLIGAIVGLIVGLVDYPPTAPFAAVELGFPATVLGTLGGAIGGILVQAGRRWRQGHKQSAHDGRARR